MYDRGVSLQACEDRAGSRLEREKDHNRQPPSLSRSVMSQRRSGQKQAIS